MELLTQALRNMTAVEDIPLDRMNLSSNACDMLMESLVANQAMNPSLKQIELFMAGGDSKIKPDQEGFRENVNFSDAAKAHVAALKANGVEVKEAIQRRSRAR